MPVVNKNGTRIEAKDITVAIVDAAIPVYPLDNTVIGVRLTDNHNHKAYYCNECGYLCILHKNLLPEATKEDLTLLEAYKEAAVCSVCITYLAIPPEFPMWDRLTKRLCNGNYSQVEIYTDFTKNAGTHLLFNYKRLVPGSDEPEVYSETGDYSAKHIADDRREDWPHAIWVPNKVFDAELEKRNQ